MHPHAGSHSCTSSAVASAGFRNRPLTRHRPPGRSRGCGSGLASSSAAFRRRAGCRARSPAGRSLRVALRGELGLQSGPRRWRCRETGDECRGFVRRRAPTWGGCPGACLCAALRTRRCRWVSRVRWGRRSRCQLCSGSCRTCVATSADVMEGAFLSMAPWSCLLLRPGCARTSGRRSSARTSTRRAGRWSPGSNR